MKVSIVNAACGSFCWNWVSDKGDYWANIKLVEKEAVLQNYSETDKKLNEFFKNVISSLGITENVFIINEEYKNSKTVTKCVLRDNLKLNDVIPVFN